MFHEDRMHSLVRQHLSREARVVMGVVSAVDAATGTVKVKIQPDDIETGWIQDTAIAAAAGVRIYTPAETGTHVALAPLQGDADSYVVIARLFDAVTPPPVTTATGKTVQPGECAIVLKDGTELFVGPGRVAIKGDLSVTGAIKADGDVTAGRISLAQHKHGGVKGGGEMTAGPQ